VVGFELMFCGVDVVDGGECVCYCDLDLSVFVGGFGLCL